MSEAEKLLSEAKRSLDNAGVSASHISQAMASTEIAKTQALIELRECVEEKLTAIHIALLSLTYGVQE